MDGFRGSYWTFQMPILPILDIAFTVQNELSWPPIAGSARVKKYKWQIRVYMTFQAVTREVLHLRFRHKIDWDIPN